MRTRMMPSVSARTGSSCTVPATRPPVMCTRAERTRRSPWPSGARENGITGAQMAPTPDAQDDGMASGGARVCALSIVKYQLCPHISTRTRGIPLLCLNRRTWDLSSEEQQTPHGFAPCPTLRVKSHVSVSI
jgi:hypothetical protein